MQPATAQRNGTPQQPQREKRMTIANLIGGRQEMPLRVTIFGTPGIGKSSFAASSPSPVFIGAEDGTSELDVQRFPSPRDFPDVLDAIAELTTAEHSFATVVIDTLDWLEPLIWSFICARDKKGSIEDYGFGKGYVAALDEWRSFLAALENLRRVRGMNVILVAHSAVRPFKNPEGDDYERYEMKLHHKAAGLVQEWSDAVLFANYETLTIENGKTKRVKGISTGARLIHTVRTAAYDAKNRFSLPDSLPLSWAEFEAAKRAGVPADPKKLEEAIRAEASGSAIEAAVTEFVAQAKGDAVKLAQLLNWVRAKLEKED